MNHFRQIRHLLLSTVFIAIIFSAVSSSALTINPTYIDHVEVQQFWTEDRMGVVDQAIADWSAAITGDYSINIDFQFVDAGSSYLAQWRGGGSYTPGDDLLPWSSGATHTIRFNTHYFNTGLSHYSWFDATPTTSDDLRGSYYDMLSVTRHELAHALGFTSDFYAENKGGASEILLWDQHITESGGNAYFDINGLDVMLAATDNLGHTANSGSTAGDLMNSAIFNGVRRDISQIDLNMLALAYDYTLAPVPVPASFLMLLSGVALIAAQARQRKN